MIGCTRREPSGSTARKYSLLPTASCSCDLLSAAGVAGSSVKAKPRPWAACWNACSTVYASGCESFGSETLKPFGGKSFGVKHSSLSEVRALGVTYSRVLEVKALGVKYSCKHKLSTLLSCCPLPAAVALCWLLKLLAVSGRLNPPFEQAADRPAALAKPLDKAPICMKLVPEHISVRQELPCSPLPLAAVVLHLLLKLLLKLLMMLCRSSSVGLSKLWKSLDYKS